MSTELERELGRLYAALTQETRYAPVASPESVRRRGDRQTRVRATLTVAAVAVVAAGVVAGGGVLLSGDNTKIQPAPTPTPSVTVPTTSPSPSSTPSPSSSASSSASSSSSASVAGKPAPTVVPKTVFLTAEELNSNTPLAKSTEPYLPELCGFDWGDTELRTSSVQGGFLRRANADPTEVPEAAFRQAVVVHASAGQAQDAMVALREAVTNCPTQQATAGRGGTYRNALVTNAPVQGDDVVVIRHQEPAYDFASGELAEGYYDFYTASVRHGDTIVTFHTSDFENWGIDDPSRFYDLVDIGAERVTTWRGPVGE